eukprot:CAMPEP_0198144634 /NCGR_PEP_ID=MMETSP1443-20131203/17182_1 /TAXON_ID=186043 /ORGANISM="Entomoneis sp., Strain CCMP2396" /LENGTH=42 /DNA_ID= /DNA_START= /DNA_END= /DNA_ORIENTATION=
MSQVIHYAEGIQEYYYNWEEEQIIEEQMIIIEKQDELVSWLT